MAAVPGGDAQLGCNGVPAFASLPGTVGRGLGAAWQEVGYGLVWWVPRPGLQD